MRNDGEAPGEAGATLRLTVCAKRLWNERSLLVVTGELGLLTAGKSAYDARYGISPEAIADGRALDRLMGAAALAAVSLAERESWGWTLTSAGAAHGLFCAVEPEGMICGTSRAARPDRAIVYLQRKKGDSPIVESRFEPVSGDPVASVQRYFEKVEQIETRLAVGADGFGALVQALPGGSLSELAAMGDDELLSTLRALAASERVKFLDDVVMFYECRCDESLILKMIAGLEEASRREIWADEKEISVACPRCGRQFAIPRGETDF